MNNKVDTETVLESQNHDLSLTPSVKDKWVAMHQQWLEAPIWEWGRPRVNLS